MKGNRQEVSNPFKDYTAGTRPGGMVKHKADLQSRVRPRSSYQSEDKGLMIVDSLVKFAGVAGDLYVKKVSKDVEADKIEQTARAMEGLAPSDDATIAGYNAHAAISIKNKAMVEQSKLNALAVRGCTDNEWRDARRAAFSNLDEYMSGKYSRYSTDKDLQKLSTLTMREMMPHVTAKKIAEDMKREIQERVNSATDALINYAKTGALSKMKPDQIIEQTDTLFKSLKLTSKQGEDIFYNAILDTKSPSLIEASKIWTGGRKTALYERNAQIQKIDAQNKRVLNTANAVGLAVEKNTLNKGFLDGTMTRENYLKRINKRNKELGKNNFMSESEIRSKLRERDKIIASEHVKRDIIKAVVNPAKTDLSEYKKKDIQSAYNTMIKDGEEKIADEVKDLPEDERENAAKAKHVQLIQHITDMSIAHNAPIESIKSDLHNLANLNVQAVTITKSTKDGKDQVERLPAYAQRAYDTYQAMSIGTKDQYLSSLGGNDEKVLRKYFNLREMNMSDSKALIESQSLVRNPVPYDAKVMQKNVDKVVDSATWSWFRKDFPANQESYMLREIRKKVGVAPMSDTNTKMVEEWLKTNWTNSDGMRLKGSPSVLQNLTGLHPSRLKGAVNAFISYESSKILPILEGRGLKIEDVFAVTDPKTGTIQLSTEDGVIPGTLISLSELKGYADKDKVNKEKLWGELANKREEENRKARVEKRAEEISKDEAWDAAMNSDKTWADLAKKRADINRKERIKARLKEIEKEKLRKGTKSKKPVKKEISTEASRTQNNKEASRTQDNKELEKLNKEGDKLKAESDALKRKEEHANNLFYHAHTSETGVKVTPEYARKELVKDTLECENKFRTGLIQGKFYPIGSPEKTDPNSGYSKYEIGYGFKLRKEWLGDDSSKWLKYQGVPVNFKKGITPEVAKGLTNMMIDKAYKTAKAAITPKLWDKMPEQERAFYADINYNSGNGVKRSKHALSLIKKGLNAEAMISELDFIHANGKPLRGLAKRRLAAYNKAALEQTGVPIIDGYRFGDTFKVHFSNVFYSDKISKKLADKIALNKGWLVICKGSGYGSRVFKADKHFKFKE